MKINRDTNSYIFATQEKRAMNNVWSKYWFNK